MAEGQTVAGGFEGGRKSSRFSRRGWWYRTCQSGRVRLGTLISNFERS